MQRRRRQPDLSAIDWTAFAKMRPGQVGSWKADDRLAMSCMKARALGMEQPMVLRKKGESLLDFDIRAGYQVNSGDFETLFTKKDMETSRNAFSIEGATIKAIMGKRGGESAAGRKWSSQDFVATYTDGQFDSDIVLTVFGDEKVQHLGEFKVGDKVDLAFNIRAREYNGRWYNDLRCWALKRSAQEQQAPQQVPEFESLDAQATDLPF